MTSGRRYTQLENETLHVKPDQDSKHVNFVCEKTAKVIINFFMQHWPGNKLLTVCRSRNTIVNIFP